MAAPTYSTDHDLHGYWKLVSCRNLPALAKSLDWDSNLPRYKMMSATGTKGLLIHITGSGSEFRIDYLMDTIRTYTEHLVIDSTKYIRGASGKPRVVKTQVVDGVVVMTAQSKKHTTITRSERIGDDIMLQEIISPVTTCSLLYKRVEVLT